MNDFCKKLFQDAKLSRDTMPVVVSSRVRLARNLVDYKFVKYACKSDLHAVAEKCENVLKICPIIKDHSVMKIADLLDYERSTLVERHLCSQEFTIETNEARLFFTDDHLTSIMINEEDHVRLQVFRADLNFKEMFDKINAIDDFLSENLRLAFDEKYGFLTSCPTNVGTGMRASVMLHLPALIMTKQINHLILAVQKLGFVVRGLFGEGSEAQGSFFQISNQQTLGISEVDILSRLAQIIRSIIDYELNSREIVKKERIVWLFDSIGRALGILKESFSISSIEAINLLSLIILAVDFGYLPEYLRDELNQVMMKIQGAHIQAIANKNMKPAERDISRAKILRDFFTTVPNLKFN